MTTNTWTTLWSTAHSKVSYCTSQATPSTHLLSVFSTALFMSKCCLAVHGFDYLLLHSKLTLVVNALLSLFFLHQICDKDSNGLTLIFIQMLFQSGGGDRVFLMSAWSHLLILFSTAEVEWLWVILGPPCGQMLNGGAVLLSYRALLIQQCFYLLWRGEGEAWGKAGENERNFRHSFQYFKMYLLKVIHFSMTSKHVDICLSLFESNHTAMR